MKIYHEILGKLIELENLIKQNEQLQVELIEKQEELSQKITEHQEKIKKQAIIYLRVDYGLELNINK